MAGTTAAMLNAEEAELYDRQIRLWGVSAQQHLRQSKVLIAGIDGVGCEAAKNLCLAGVGSIHLLDNNNLKEEDTQTNFLADSASVGKNVAEACSKNLQNLNPNVKVTTESNFVDDKNESFFKDFDLVIVTRYPVNVVKKVNEKCRNVNTKLMAGNVNGFFGYFFIDVLEHLFEETVEKESKTATFVEEEYDNDEPAAKKSKVEDQCETIDSETVTQKTLVKYSTIKSALEQAHKLEKKKVRRMDLAFFIYLMIFEFQEKHNRHPSIEHEEKDSASLKEIRSRINEKFGLKETMIQDEMLKMINIREFSGPCAIVGGFVAQESIKILSKNANELPLNNLFFYNAISGGGTVLNLGKEE